MYPSESMSTQFQEFLYFCKLQTQQGQQTALATIVETQGSSYQKAGARMVIASNGEYCGILAGGCFEGDLIEQAGDVFNTGDSKMLFYDMRSSDDAIWGLGLGCNGAVRIMLQPLCPENAYSPLSLMLNAAQAKETISLCTVVETEHPELTAGLTFTIEDQHASDTEVISGLYQHAQQCLNEQRNAFDTFSVGGKSITAFCETILPPRQLLLLGAGPDAVPLTHMASQLRWEVTLADHRQAYLKPDRFPKHVSLVSVSPDSLHQDLDLNRFDAMVLMTHSIDYDRRYLIKLAECTIPYIGLLGPSHRRDQLFSQLGDKADLIRPRSHGPVGLDIGAKTPDEIALSILAEIQAAYNGRSGKMLDDYPLQSCHERMPN